MAAPAEVTPMETPLQIIVAALREQIRLLTGGASCWRIPSLKKRYQPASGMHYHFCPELFILTGGECQFTFPSQTLTVRAGEICLVPGGIPHRERVRSTSSDYRSVIVNFYNKTVYTHGAHDDGRGFPAPDSMFFFTTSFYADAITILSRIGELHQDDPRGNAVAIRGLLTGVFAMLVQVFDASQAQPSQVRDLVTRGQWLVKRHANNPALSLGMLASQLELSPSHLSRIFREKTGERLGEYITRVKIENATEGLRTTQLSVKAIGAACGFADTSYFCRVFRLYIGQSPQDYRAKFYRDSLEVERRPKTVLAEGTHFVGGGVYAPLALSELNVFDALRCTRLSIAAIAIGGGFTDEAAFTQYFRAATGQTPEQYRTDSQSESPQAAPA